MRHAAGFPLERQRVVSIRGKFPQRLDAELRMDSMRRGQAESCDQQSKIDCRSIALLTAVLLRSADERQTEDQSGNHASEQGVTSAGGRDHLTGQSGMMRPRAPIADSPAVGPGANDQVDRGIGVNRHAQAGIQHLLQLRAALHAASAAASSRLRASRSTRASS